MNYLVFCATLLAVVGAYFIFRKFFEKYNKVVTRVFSLLIFVAFFIATFASKNNLLYDVVGVSTNNPFPSNFLCSILGFLFWLTTASVVILQIVSFFDFKVLKNYVKFFCLPISILNALFMQCSIYLLTGSVAFSLSGVFFAILTALCLALSVYVFIKNGMFKITKNELLEMLKILPFVLIFSIPPYLPRLLWGNVGQMLTKGLALYHRLYLYLSFICIFATYFALKKKGPEYSRMILLYISLVTLISYVYRDDFAIFVHPTSWPLHLCNTAMFVVPICLIFKWEKLFYFTLFINVLGAFFAMLMPNYGDASLVFDPGIVRFWINHIMAFAMPLLIVMLGVYQKPKLKQFTYSMIAFLVYFIFVLVINAWFTNYDGGVDFFFVNSDFIAKKLGRWAERLRNVTTTINVKDLKLVFYPIYQLLFFLVYVALGLGMWFLYAYLFQIQDFYDELNKKREKIKLDELALCAKYGKKEINDCMNEESLNKLVVKNATKRYGTSKVFSLSNASFEVHGGEILGFLGPNGAGKSTLIKSIVGMQPLTYGSIEINGYDIEKQPVLAKSQLGFVPDHYALYEKLTGREYVNYIADLYNIPKQERDIRLDKLVEQLEMKHAFDNQIRTYSHGMKQKIAIMSALVHNPKLWILDEPLTGLDPNSIHQVKECMKQHAKEGNIVFFSSHLIDIVEKLCDRIIIIKKGKVRTQITLNELKEKGIDLEQFYLDIINNGDDEAEKVDDELLLKDLKEQNKKRKEEIKKEKINKKKKDKKETK